MVVWWSTLTLPLLTTTGWNDNSQVDQSRWSLISRSSCVEIQVGGGGGRHKIIFNTMSHVNNMRLIRPQKSRFANAYFSHVRRYICDINATFVDPTSFHPCMYSSQRSIQMMIVWYIVGMLKVTPFLWTQDQEFMICVHTSEEIRYNILYFR